MKIYWSWKNVPELAGLAPEERKRICSLYKYKFLKDRRFWFVVIIFMIIFGFITGSVPELRNRLFPELGLWGRTAFIAVPCGILGCFYGITISQIQLRAMLPFIRKDLGLDDTNNPVSTCTHENDKEQTWPNIQA